MTATLSSSHSDKLTRQELGNVPNPVALGPQHRPIQHLELVETIEARLKVRLNATVEREEYAVRKDGLALFGTMSFTYGASLTTTAAIGLRHANDLNMSLQLVAGMSVFVCDNMVLRGDMIFLREKHLLNFNLADSIDAGIAKFQEHFTFLERETQLLRDTVLSDHAAKAFILEAFVNDQVMPMNLIRRVYDEYFEPTHAAFGERTAWSLHNAFTQVAKDMPLTSRLPATQKLGRLMGLTS